MGPEAAILAQRLGDEVPGIDLKNNFDRQVLQIANLQAGDTMNLSVADESFDFVFSFHAFELIENPNKGLKGIYRVLKTGGGYWIGTPNKSRNFGYIGGKKLPFRRRRNGILRIEKRDLPENLKINPARRIYRKRASRFTDETFPDRRGRNAKLLLKVYKNYESLVKEIIAPGLSQFIFPGVYLAAKNKGAVSVFI